MRSHSTQDRSAIAKPDRILSPHPGLLPLPNILRIFWGASLAACALMFLIAWLHAHARMARAGWDPLGDPFLGDLLEDIPTLKLVHTAAFWSNPLTPPVAYPPFGAVLLGLCYATGAPSAFYLALALAALAVGIWYVRQALLAQGIRPATATLFPLTLAAVSFPIEGLLQRGNIELFVWVFAVTGTWMFFRGQSYVAALFWALAASVKLYPIIFLVLLVPRRQYRALLLGLASFVVISIGSMLYLGPTLKTAWAGSLANVFGYQGKRVGEWNLHEITANHSFFTWVKTAAIVSGHSTAGLTLPYYLCGGILFALLFFGRLRRLPLANQLLGVSAFMVLLPPVSYFYTLVHLYPPWLVLTLLAVRAQRTGVPIAGLRTTLLLFLPVFASFTLFTFPQALIFGGLVQAACLVMLVLCSANFPFAEPNSLEPALSLDIP